MYEDQELDAQHDIEKELAAFREEEAGRMGLGRGVYKEKINTDFKAADRAHTTLWVSGLTFSQDLFVAAALRGIGYRVDVLDVPDNAALQFGKEFGNRGQCNPTYFTVGNLVKHLCRLRDEQGVPTKEIIEKHIFLTAGACGPCRFGMYVTEYRKALRDAGFDGFRVMLFQQQGGVKQATGDEVGLQVNAAFGWALARSMLVGDVVGLMGYRLRPYEVEPGSTDAAIDGCRRIMVKAFETNGSILAGLIRCRRLLGKVRLDRSQPKPVVSVIGEFWAMTTEGDGNYHLQRFLEQEGAEVEIQPIVNWFLFMIWENRYDTEQRLTLREQDGGRKGLDGKDARKKLLGLQAAEVAVRGLFQTYAKAIGLHGYHLPDMNQIAALAKPYYDNAVRGGEAHMEVGKLIHFIQDRCNHLTISVKPFGCMPSSGVSDGVQTIVQSLYPDSLFLPLETTGDGKVNAHSRVQMVLFRARQRAREEYEAALAQKNLTADEAKTRISGKVSAFYRPRHEVAGMAANLVLSLRG